MHTETLDASPDNPTACRGFKYSLANQNGSPADGAVFTYDSNTKVFSIYTTDTGKATHYSLRLTVEYDDPCLTQSATLDFTVSVIDPDCLAATMTIDVSIL